MIDFQSESWVQLSSWETSKHDAWLENNEGEGRDFSTHFYLVQFFYFREDERKTKFFLAQFGSPSLSGDLEVTENKF